MTPPTASFQNHRRWFLPSILACLFTATSPSHAEARAWTDVQGRKVTAEFVSLEADQIVLKTADGKLHRFAASRLIPEDLAFAQKAQPAAAEATTPAASPAYLPGDTSVAASAQKIDELVAKGLVRANPERAKNGKAPITQFNAPASDEHFVRRVYLDIAGRIPNYEEASSFIQDQNKDKRSKLIDQLLNTDGYKSHMFNFIADMLRIKDDYTTPNVFAEPYIAWVKEQIIQNRPWNEMVYEMLTATGKMWDKKPDGTYNGAAGYLLRDEGMRLDNLANTLAAFLGSDLSCAQCHDHPFSDWTRNQFYEMAAFFGSTTTRLSGADFESGDPSRRLMPELEKLVTAGGGDIRKFRIPLNLFIGANRSSIRDRSYNEVHYNEDGKDVKGAKPGDPVKPKFISWTSMDANNPAYNQKKAKEEKLRVAFGSWLTHPQHPRFATNIANRLWKRAFGLAVSEPVYNIDDPKQAVNPELLTFLTKEMVRLKFDMKQFMRILYNTRAYQSEATSEAIAYGEPYYFQGPILRRMSAEQAWDSYMTLVLGQPDQFKPVLPDLYAKSIDVNLETVDPKTVLIKFNAFRNRKRTRDKLKGGDLSSINEDMMMAGGSKKNGKSDTMMGGNKVISFGDAELLRASEIEQPAPGGHFLADFGQSQRILADAGSRVGSVPQILMMMNGQSQKMLTSSDSLIFRTMEKVNSPSEKVERMFLSIMNRMPTLDEKDIAKRVLATGDNGYANMIWALINTREFIFIQ
jgi:Protein of unknown function (DUF1549)/Protein of unknown function (DUF1553)/SLA1 homology domain 1, SHD1